MPLLTIKTNVTLENKTQLAEAASLTVANILNKPESYVMVHIEDKQCLLFAGEENPCALLELKSLGLAEDTTGDLSNRLCDFIFTQTSIPPSRVYIEFSSPQRHMWGWDKRTF